MHKSKSLLLLTLTLSSALGVAEDRISGVAEVDFNANKLKIPCVEVKNLNDQLNGKFFDAQLRRQDDSLTFVVELTQPEDPAVCRQVADFSKFNDDDFVDDSLGQGGNGNLAGNGKILVVCERRSNRSKVSVNGNNLASGAYIAEITSGVNSAISNLKQTVGDEVEFDFDSALDDIARGATAIPANFIQGPVNAEIRDDSGNVVTVAQSVPCRNK